MKNLENDLKGTDDLISRVDEKSVIVFDFGTYYTKIGYSGNDKPKFIIPTCIASSKDQIESDLSAAKVTRRFGNEAISLFPSQAA